MDARQGFLAGRHSSGDIMPRMCLPIQALVRHHTHIISSRPTIDISTELSLCETIHRHLEQFPHATHELAPDAVNFLRKSL